MTTALMEPDSDPRSWITAALALAGLVAASRLGPLAKLLLQERRLIKNFVVRDLKVRYVGSSIGFFWSVIYPVVLLCVFFFVFRMILGVRWGDQTPPSQAALYMLAGILVWNSFSETIVRTTNCLVENANLIKKVVFPSEVLGVYLTLSSLVNMAIGVPVLLVAVVLLATSPDAGFLEPDLGRLSPALLWLPFLGLLQAAFTAGLGYVLATVNVFLRDVHQIVGVGMQVWMFGTPIFYPDSLVISKGYGWLIAPNPMYWLVEAYRAVLLEGRAPDWIDLARFACVAVIMLAIGASVFRRQRQHFPDLL